MSNSGSEGAWSGFDEVPRDVRPRDGDPCRFPWDSSRDEPEPEDS